MKLFLYLLMVAFWLHSSSAVAGYTALSSISFSTDSLEAETTSVDSFQSVVVADTVKQKAKKGDATRFQAKQLILPASLVAVGALGVSIPKLKEWNTDLRDGLADWRNGHYFRADDYLQYLPVVAHLGLGFLPLKGKHTHVERICVLATSYATMGILVNGIKYTVKERRPDGSSRNSFPSGHSATAFMGAELVRLEYKNASPWYGAGAYVVACGVAFLRMYNERHWCNDVLAGAGIGILSARVGYWLLPLERKWFRLDRKKESGAVLVCPYYDNFNKGAGAMVTAVF